MSYNYDKILVWNKILKNQAKNIYNYKDKNLKIVGIPNLEDFYNFKPIKKNKFLKNII